MRPLPTTEIRSFAETSAAAGRLLAVRESAYRVATVLRSMPRAGLTFEIQRLTDAVLSELKHASFLGPGPTPALVAARSELGLAQKSRLRGDRFTDPDAAAYEQALRALIRALDVLITEYAFSDSAAG
jgi:hypothetical protein